MLDATHRVVAQMANGGLEPLAGMTTPEEQRALIAQAMETCKALHREISLNPQWGRPLKVWKAHTFSSLPGTRTASKKTKSRQQNLVESIKVWPHLFKIHEMDLIPLDSCLNKHDDVVLKHGMKELGGGWDAWPTVWDSKEEFQQAMDGANDFAYNSQDAYMEQRLSYK